MIRQNLTMYLQHDEEATLHNTEEGKQLEVWSLDGG